MPENEAIYSTGIIELIRRSIGEIKQDWVLAVFLIILTGISVSAIAWLFGHKDASSGVFMRGIDDLKALPLQEFICLIVAFFWNDSIAKKRIQNLHASSYLNRAALFIAYAFAILLLGIIIGVISNVIFWVIVGGIYYSNPSSGVGDILVLMLPATLMLGSFLALLFLLRLFFVFPAVVFGQKVNLSIAWRQSRGWGWRLLVGSLLFGIPVMVFPSLLAIFYLIFVGYVAHAYLAATGLSNRPLSATVQ